MRRYNLYIDDIDGFDNEEEEVFGVLPDADFEDWNCGGLEDQISD